MENKLQIIFESNNFFIINKESGLTVNRSDTTLGEQTLQDLIDNANLIKNSNDSEFISRSGIVHRLDKETSGVLIVAKNSEYFNLLQAQFKERLVRKEYIALVHGEIQPKSGEINAPIARLPWNRKRFGVIAGGREALTKYECISNYSFIKSKEKMSLVRVYPKTGRTHQIRVHLKYINYPIFSDELYGGRKIARNDRKILKRIFLHAEKISFNEPKTNEKLNFIAEMPSELTDLLEKLKLTSDN